MYRTEDRDQGLGVGDRVFTPIRRGSAAFIGACMLILTAQRASAASVTEIHYTMGTYLSITVQGVEDAAARTAMRRCFGEARRLESVFSRYDPDSELSRVNTDRSVTTVSADLAELLRRSLALREETAGAFDVTIGALTALWRDSTDWPVTERIAAARAEPIQVRGQEIARSDPSVQLDFDGVAKGYAVDRCVALLRAAGISRALINLGESSQFAVGAPEGGRGWSLAVRGGDADVTIGIIRLRDQALSASAVFGHSRTIAGKRIGHIIDPASGAPLRRNSVAVVVADNATDAEAYSKAVLIWGERETAQPNRNRSPRRRGGPVWPPFLGQPHRVAATVGAGIIAALYIDDERVTGWHADAMHFRARRAHLTAAEVPLR